MMDAKNQIGVYDCDLGSLELLKPEMPKMWIKYREYFIHEINYISKAFWEAFMSSQKSFIGMKLDEIVSGTLLLPYEHAAICYYIDMPNNNYKLLEVRFDNQLHMLANSDSEYGFETEYIKQPEGELVENAFAIVVGFHLFKKYAKVEIKEVAHNSKVTDKLQQNKELLKIINESSFNITLMDSTWFTTIVRNEGFKVRGHFRLQPKKNNEEWTKELIYIDEYQKSGYHRQAKKLKNDLE
ncbi:MAG: hypothetical protein LBL58_02515 [Tannerellaceae bacterium]|jgi:hypothetical protein|nr:hypothetical protein [Tannerellaceae bacterium]